MASVKRERPTRKERARATRLRIAQAAQRLFAANGYQATTMERVAREAGVAVQTVYFVFHTKAELLQEACRLAVLGDDETPPEEQQWYRDLEHERDGKALLAAFVDNIAPIAARTAPMSIVVRAAPDEDAALVYEQAEHHRRAAYQHVIRLLAAHGLLREKLDETEATDILMLLAGPQPFHVLVTEYGWPAEKWAAWTTQVLCTQLLPH